MGVIVNELEVVVEAPDRAPGADAGPALPADLSKPAPRALTVQDLERIRQDLRARDQRLTAD